MCPDWAGAPTSVSYAQFGDPQSLNLYSYVRNSPIIRIDATGHFDDPFGVFSDGDTSTSNIQSRQGAGEQRGRVISSAMLGSIEITHSAGTDPHNQTGSSDTWNESGASNSTDDSRDGGRGGERTMISGCKSQGSTKLFICFLHDETASSET